jgi:MoxR-like ATPase
MMKVIVKYPDKNEEQLIIRSQVRDTQLPGVEPVIHLSEVNEGKALTRQVYIDEKIEKYIVDIVFATRFPDQYNLSKLKNIISYGASPRAKY